MPNRDPPDRAKIDGQRVVIYPLKLRVFFLSVIVERDRDRFSSRAELQDDGIIDDCSKTGASPHIFLDDVAPRI